MSTLISDSGALVIHIYFECKPLLKAFSSAPAWLTDFTDYFAHCWKLQPHTPTNKLVLHRWEQENTGAQMTVSRLPQVEDTVVVSLLSKQDGEVTVAWQHIKKRFSAQLDTWLTTAPNIASAADFIDSLTGYSLIYLASTQSLEGDLESTTVKACTSGIGVKTIAVSNYAEGKLWLLAQPKTSMGRQYQVIRTQQKVEGIGWRKKLFVILLNKAQADIIQYHLQVIARDEELKINAHSTYVALTTPQHYKRFVEHSTALRSPDAPLLGPDLVAHKSYYQHYSMGSRNDLSSRRSQYENHLEGVFNRTQVVMSQLGKGTSDDDNEVKLLARQYGRLMTDFSIINRLDNSLEKQVINMNAYLTGTSGDNGRTIWQHHLVFIKTYLQDAKLLLSKSNIALQAAQTAISFVEQQQDRLNNKRLSKTQTLLGFIGFALALTQLLKGEVLLALITSFTKNAVSKEQLVTIAKFKAEFWLFIILASISVLVFLLNKPRKGRRNQ